MLGLWRLKGVLIVAFVAITVAAIAGGLWFWGGGKPDQWAMRAYLISKLSDDQIRQIHKSAEKDEKEAIRGRQKDLAQQSADRAEQRRKCSDVVYKTRNSWACQLDIIPDQPPSMRMYGALSVEEEFELLLMGRCEYVTTVWRAKWLGCLPP